MVKRQHIVQKNLPRVIAASLLLSLAGPAWAASLSAQVSQAKSDQGVVRCGLFKEAATWRIEEQALRTVEASLHGGQATCDFGEVPPGDYAIAAFHAEQGEAKVSYGFLGKPKQGVGFSNNPSITFGPPDFDEALFKIQAEPVSLSIQLKY